VVWSYAATFFMVGAGVLLFPFILNKMSAETVGIWNIFQTITALILLLDFGFRPSFARNISYIFSGVRELKREGVNHVGDDTAVDYSLLKATIVAMQRFYRWMALAVLGILATVGSLYFWYILNKYTGDRTDAIVAWLLLIAINCYNLYTLYYDALLTGKGYVKRSQQILIIAQVTYIVVAIVLIYMGLGLSAIVSAQLLSTIIRRAITKRVFFRKSLRERLAQAETGDVHAVMQAITPNAVKVGLTYLGAFCITKSAVLLGSFYLPLAAVASFGITMQVMDVLSRCGQVFYVAYTPRLAQCRAENDLPALRRYYLLSVCCLVVVFIVGGALWIECGDWALRLIHSNTTFIETSMLLAALAINFLENNHAVAAGFIMADNRIPFFIPSLASGAATLVLLWLLLGPLDMGIWGMILAPGIAQLAYQNWKWPSMVIKELFLNVTNV